MSAMLNAVGYRSTSVFDAASQHVVPVDPLGNRATSFDLAGGPVSVVDANNKRTSTVYDVLRRVAARVSAFSYRYDNTSNRTGVTESTGDRVTWSYDATYQLVN